MLTKSILLAFAAVPAVLGAALSPITEAADVDSGITWTGRIFKTDKDVTTLHGDASDIYAQILAINPDYVASEIAPEDAASALAKRGETRTCGTMAVGNNERVIQAASDLKKLGQQCGAPAKSCRRMTCKDTTATYICSENNNAVSIPCRDAGRMVGDIQLNCCQGYRAGRSGYIYMNWEYSIWVGYGNCNHASSVYPNTYPYPGGQVNGLCYND